MLEIVYSEAKECIHLIMRPLVTIVNSMMRTKTVWNAEIINHFFMDAK